MAVRGLRGAITVEADKAEEVLSASSELLEKLIEMNPTLRSEDVASALFTATEDIRSVFPAKAARGLGWTAVPLMSAREIPVEGSLPLCVRVLITWNTPLSQAEVRHVYLRGATVLRPDLSIV